MDSIVDEKIEADTYLEMKTWDEVRSKYNLNIVDTTIKNTYNTTIANLE